ncbi:hypothetical protein IWW45_003774 [Coemansia sp. RSA 485]|nr:hypothetical protein IWW45_003774 [Coemansia sp. RSA 485]
MWSLFGRKGTTVTCWFCNQKTWLPQPDNNSAETPNDWHCNKCDNQNTIDKQGNIVDSRDEMYKEAPVPVQHTRFEEKKARVFCSSCQRNQELVCQILSSYLPDEEDPEYNDRLQNAEKYASQLRRRYPLVCRNCQSRVDERLQQQAQWVYRRELANALKKSANARNTAPLMQVQPTLRKKGMVVTWFVCAIIALFVCPLSMWIWYLYAFLGRLPDSAVSFGAALFLAFTTYFSRLLNPLWLYLAFNPGMRVSGLPMYRRRVTYLTWLRLAATCLRTASLPAFAWIAITAADISLCLLAACSLRTRSGRRPRSSKKSQPSHQAETDGSSQSNLAPSADPQQTFASFQNLSFGLSETNMDQDDTLAGLNLGSSQDSQWTRRPSFKRRTNNKYQTGTASVSSDEDDDTNEKHAHMSSDLMAGLGTMSFGSQSTRTNNRETEDMEVDLVSLMGPSAPIGSGSSSNFGNGLTNSKPFSNTQGKAAFAGGPSKPRPFEAFRFQRQNSTGLEHKMSSFSLSDSDDDSYQGLFGSIAMDSWFLGGLQRLGTVQGMAAIGSVCTLLMGTLLPLWVFWVERALLITATGLATTTTTTNRVSKHAANSNGLRRNIHAIPKRPSSPATMTPNSARAFPRFVVLRRAAGCVLLLCLIGIPITLTAYLAESAAITSSLSGTIQTTGTADLAFAELISPGNPALLLRWPLAKRSIGAVVQKYLFRTEPAAHSVLLLSESLSAYAYTLVQVDYVVEFLSLAFGAQFS